jgi:hypothetical protein
MEPSLYLLICIWLGIIVYLIMHELSQEWTLFTYKNDRILPNYFNALRVSNIDEFITDELEFRDFGFNILDDEAIQRCNTSKKKMV